MVKKLLIALAAVALLSAQSHDAIAYEDELCQTEQQRIPGAYGLVSIRERDRCVGIASGHVRFTAWVWIGAIMYNGVP